LQAGPAITPWGEEDGVRSAQRSGHLVRVVEAGGDRDLGSVELRRARWVAHDQANPLATLGKPGRDTATEFARCAAHGDQTSLDPLPKDMVPGTKLKSASIRFLETWCLAPS
jgi:hypothetical protein